MNEKECKLEKIEQRFISLDLQEQRQEKAVVLDKIELKPEIKKEIKEIEIKKDQNKLKPENKPEIKDVKDIKI